MIQRAAAAAAAMASGSIAGSCSALRKQRVYLQVCAHAQSPDTFKSSVFIQKMDPIPLI